MSFRQPAYQRQDGLTQVRRSLSLRQQQQQQQQVSKQINLGRWWIWLVKRIFVPINRRSSIYLHGAFACFSSTLRMLDVIFNIAFDYRRRICIANWQSRASANKMIYRLIANICFLEGRFFVDSKLWLFQYKDERMRMRAWRWRRLLSCAYFKFVVVVVVVLNERNGIRCKSTQHH